MKLPRREFLHLAAGAAALPFAPHVARAQAYPSRPVKIVVGQAAGSATDIVVRLFGQFLSKKLGQQFIIEVRPGAAGNIATEAVTHMPPDGYSLLAVNSQNAINVALYEKLNFDFVRDIAPIALVETVPLIMEVHPSVPAKTVVEFVAYAKANPGKLNMASAGIGGPQHIAGELFKFMAGVDLAHIPYRGSTPAVTDLVAGQVQVMFDVTATALPQVKAGTTAGARRDDERAACVPAGRADHRQRAQGLRGARLGRLRRPRGHAARHHRDAQQADQYRPWRPEDQAAAHRTRRHTGGGELARRVCQIHQR